ncbi:MacS family sensor histidine kinase [Calidifontibacter terrae]
MSTATLERDTSGTLPLWRAAQVFRFASLLYAGAVQWTVSPKYDRQLLSWAVFAVLLLWSGIAGTLLSFGHRHRALIVGIEHVLTLGLMSMTLVIGPASYFARHQTVPTTFWAANAVVSAAILLGPWWGGLSAAVVGLSALAICDQLDNLRFDATLPILLTVGLAVGFGAQVVRRARAQIDRAVRLEAATAERERLAREVHDTTLQVLAYVRREGLRIGGATEKLAVMAGEQEDALRRLLSRQATASVAVGDLRARLEVAVPDTSISAPEQPIELPGAVTDELVAVVRAIVDNTTKHAGPQARSYALLEDLGDELVVTVRDDGVGTDLSRFAEAAGEGRMGVSKSIVGRMRALGGSADCYSEPGEGTEWELRLPQIRAGEGT